MTHSLKANAKLNLVLAVGERQDDGYHQLASVMTRLELADELRATLVPSSTTTIDVSAPTLPQGDTLVTSAIEGFLSAAGISAQVKVELTKNIPHGAGLGGGSSDAGAILLWLEECFPSALAPGVLQRIAAGVGSDVPYFIGKGPAIVRGRGDRIDPIELSHLNGLPVTVLWPRVELSTPLVYEALVKRRNSLPKTRDLIDSVQGHDWYNDLAEPARAACPPLDRLCELLDGIGARYQVAGSGSSVAVFGKHDDVWNAFPDEIRNKDTMWVAQTRLVT